MLYGRYFDDTLVVAKPEDLSCVHNALNKFDRSLKFTSDAFNDVFLHFLDMVIHQNGLELYWCKPINTDQYTH